MNSKPLINLVELCPSDFTNLHPCPKVLRVPSLSKELQPGTSIMNTHAPNERPCPKQRPSHSSPVSPKPNDNYQIFHPSISTHTTPHFLKSRYPLSLNLFSQFSDRERQIERVQNLNFKHNNPTFKSQINNNMYTKRNREKDRESHLCFSVRILQ
jgi:hypothetical protein